MAYTSPKVEVRKSEIAEEGVFAKEKIAEGELVCDFAGSKGKFYTNEERQAIGEKWLDYDLQVDDNLFWGATKDADLETCDYINHSCNPNCGIRGALRIVAMRDIEPGEEVTFDYAMAESHDDFDIECGCKRPNCRKRLTGHDWKNKKLQEKYRGYFSDYLQRKIDQQYDAGKN